MTLAELLLLKYPEIDLMGSVIVQDEGAGPYIAKWEYNLGPKPTEQDVQQWEQELELEYRQELVRQERRRLYPSWQDQLDMQYHDAMNNTTVWIDTIEAIKVNNPIPQE